jgi:RimJ/RimL family protein N-acetyltransferase
MNRVDLKAAPATLLTPRLRLESPRADHATAFAEGVIASMADLRFVSWGTRPRDVEWARRFCEDDATSIAAGLDLAFHIFEVESGAWIGRIDVHSIDFSCSRAEMGYVGDSRHAGRGLMREAAVAIIELCFKLGIERIEAISDARNQRAVHFAQTIGMQREGVLRRHERDPQGQLCDMVISAVLNPNTEAAAPAAG